MNRYASSVMAAVSLYANIAGADFVKQEIPDAMGEKAFGGFAGSVVTAAPGGSTEAIVGILEW